MDHEEVGRYWDENAEVWTELVRAGYDHYRAAWTPRPSSRRCRMLRAFSVSILAAGRGTTLGSSRSAVPA